MINKAWRTWKGHTRHHTVAGRAVGRHVNKKARAAYVRWRELLFEGGLTALLHTGKLILFKELAVVEEEAMLAHVHAREGRELCSGLHAECQELHSALAKANAELAKLKGNRIASFRRPTVASLLATAAVAKTVNGEELMERMNEVRHVTATTHGDLTDGGEGRSVLSAVAIWTTCCYSADTMLSPYTILLAYC